MNSKDVRAFWITGQRSGQLRTVQLAPRQSDEVLVRNLYSGISRGTELLVFNGQIPASEYQRMRAPFQEGEFPAPVKYGYCSVGIVEEGPDKLRDQTVFCLYPHQTHYVVPAHAVIPLPQAVPAKRAILTANLETAINGLWDATPRIGDRISIVGAGTVGCLVAWLAVQLPGCSVELIDVDTTKQSIAGNLSVRFATPETASTEVDLVIHASGSPAGLTTALNLAGFEATVVELSWFGSQSVVVPLGQAFHAKRLRLQSSQVGTVASAQRARWTYRRRMELALSLLQDAVLDCLITGENSFADLPTVMTRLANDELSSTLCHRIRY